MRIDKDRTQGCNSQHNSPILVIMKRTKSIAQTLRAIEVPLGGGGGYLRNPHQVR